MNQKARAYIRTSMYSVTTAQLKHHKMAKDILNIVKEMFGSTPDMNKQKMLGYLLSIKMPKGGSVVNYVLKLVEYI